MNSKEMIMIERLTECNLATVEYLMCMKSKNKSEYKRQQAIAQEGIDFLKENKVKCKGRCAEVLEIFNGRVGYYVTTHELYNI